jgi:hypothetical protein
MAGCNRGLCRWVRDYVGFLEGDPVAKYARMMGNFVGTNVDEQLLAAYIYLSSVGQSAEYREKALQIAHWSALRQEDQIDGGVFRYESDRQRSLDFTQQCLLVLFFPHPLFMKPSQSHLARNSGFDHTVLLRESTAQIHDSVDDLVLL